MLASVEGGFQALDRHLPTDLLIAEARRLNEKLLTGDLGGPLQRSAVAKRLMNMHRVLDARLQAAPRDKKTLLPSLHGVKWVAGDPLAGIVEGISPFHMIDWWGTLVTDPGPPPLRRRRAAKASFDVDVITVPAPKKPSAGKPGKEPSSEGIGKGLEEEKKKHPDLGDFAKGMGGAAGEIAADIAAEFVPILAIAKGIYDMVTDWIGALQAGVNNSAQRIARMVFTDALASMAVKIKDAPAQQYRIVQQGNSRFRLPIPEGDVAVPAPDDSLAWPSIQDLVKSWKHPSDQIAVPLGRRKGLEFARKFIASMEQKRKGSGVRYLRWLKTKFKGSRVAIRGYIVDQLISK
jgi:hypothetical protein